jgi:ArsR family transcriptional regulator
MFLSASDMKNRILFLCTENSARSQMAEALVNSLYGDGYQAFSAGTEPSEVDPRARIAIENFGISSKGLRSKSTTDMADESFNYVITLCEKAYGECQLLDFGGEKIAWDFQDPKTRSVALPFDVTLKEINERLKMFMLVTEKREQKPKLTPLQLFKCLADETRLDSLMLIQEEQELCVCELTAALDLSQPKISRHLAQLRECGLLADRRQGQWVFYQINPALPDWARNVVRDTHRRHFQDLAEKMERLKKMGDRPERAAVCC